jgi:glycosyltransferase involved in cell wall biosynthesis
MVLPRWVRDGGAAAHVGASARALAERGVRVSILVARVEDDLAPSGVSLLHSPRLFDRSAAVEERLGEALACEPSLIHLNQLGDPAVVGFLRQRAPVVISAHSYLACTSGVHYFRAGQECRRAHGPGCVPNLPRCAHSFNVQVLPGAYATATRELAALHQADLAISYSSAVDRHLAINGVARRRVVPYFPTVSPARRTAPEAARRVLFAGRVVPLKGLATLVRAMRALDAELVVCGDGRALPAIRRLVGRLGMAQRVSFRGWLDADELAREFADCSLVALPSLWPEPFGIVGIEGFAAGRPAVASATGGVEDWLEHGVSGLTVPAGEVQALAGALRELLEDPTRATHMGAAGRAALAARFTLEHHLAALSQAYAEAARFWSADGGRERSLAAA